jgi:MYXO-CTERM domain-containing protein
MAARGTTGGIAACTIALLAGCQGVEVGVGAAPLVGGVAAPDDHAVVLIETLEAGEVVSGCTGTLVAPDLVLTAAHCLPRAGQSQRVHFGSRAFDDPAALGDRAVVASEAAPGWTGDHERGHDLAMLRLAAPAPAGVAPLPVAATGLELHRGMPVRLVGFGLTLVDDEPFERRSADTTLGFVSETIVFAGALGGGGPQICDGDSGGPILAVIDGIETVVAVASFSDPLCRSSSGGSRIDADLGFLAGWLTGDRGGGDEACGHDLCETGEALAATCDPCVARICQRDPFCCTSRWDSGCSDLAQLDCPASCDGKADALDGPAAGCAAAPDSSPGGAALLLLALLAAARRRGLERRDAETAEHR